MSGGRGPGPSPVTPRPSSSRYRLGGPSVERRVGFLVQAEVGGRVALVTGAGSQTGIGFACATVLAREGAAVAVTSTTDRIEARAGELHATVPTPASWPTSPTVTRPER